MVKTIIGIDEAGRGPVIGPMVMAGVKISEDKLADIACMGIKDSKLLSPSERERLFDIIINTKWIEYHIEISWPNEIDNALESPNMNLNLLESLHSAMILGRLNGEKAILDLPSNNALAYIRSVQKFMKPEIVKSCTIVAEHKADMNYPIVGAASIIAKVTRDRLIEEMKIKLSKHGDFGSGYPSDPKTKAFVLKNWNNSELLNYKNGFFRKTWASYKNVSQANYQKGLGDY